MQCDVIKSTLSLKREDIFVDDVNDIFVTFVLAIFLQIHKIKIGEFFVTNQLQN